VQGSSSILIIDFITGKTVDMVDLTCLVDIQQGSETPLLIRLSFIYGKNDRRVVKFVMEDLTTLRELLDLLEPVATVNKTGRLNETVSALFKCLRCDAVFPYEDHRFEGPSVSCQECRSNEVVEFFVHSQDKYGAPDADVDDDSGAMNAGQGVSRMTSPDRAPETMPYSIIVAEDTFDCRTVDHNRKLVLNLSLFEDDSERFLGGIECILFSAETGVVSAFVVLSTKAVYSLTIGAHNALSLIRRMDFREFQHVSIAINSARLRLGLRGLHVDLVIGDDFKTWDFLQLLADAPGLSDCSVRVDATFSDAIGREVPDALVQGGTQLGCLQDLVSRATRAAEWRQRVALISQADGNPLVLCVIARSATDGDHPCVLVAQGTDLHVMQLYPANASMYVVGGGFAMSRVIDITEIEKLQYCESEPRRIRILRWSEGRSTPAGDPDSDYFTTESTRALRQFVEQLDSLWEPIFGFHLPLEKVKRLV
jgi:DNA-directed RNA polymerase subunit RPC12/RpoP